MKEPRPDVFSLGLSQIRARGNYSNVAAVRQTRNGLPADEVQDGLRDGLIVSSLTTEAFRDMVPPGMDVDPDYVPVAVTVFSEKRYPRQSRCVAAILDIEDLKEFVNQAMALIAAKEREIGRI